MNVPKGYKMTEVGVIPEDWEVKKLGDIAEIISGGTPKTNVPEYWNGSIKWCTPTDITKCSGKYLFETDRTISSKGLVNSSAKLLPIGTLLLCSRATIGEIRIAAVEISTNQGFKSLVCKSEVSNEFLYYKLLTMKSVMLEKAIGSTFLELAKKEVASLEIDLPPLPEQQAIARVLSDTDALINALDKLIAKKRDIKKAVMQELLTGKTRLPGFSGEWEVKRLGDVASITMGQSPSSKYYNIEGVGLPLIQGNADIENRETVIRIYTSQITKKCYRNNIILSVRAPVGEVARATFDACIGRGVCAISYPSNFLYQYLMFSESSWSKLSKGSTFDSVNYKEISNFELYLPSDYAEQEAIAQVLSDIDSEITALEKRRDKMKALKQGMMQELLTGRIRLK
jgi:type I restriction enzyme S subunit